MLLAKSSINFEMNYENKRSFNFPENLIFLNLSKYFFRNLTDEDW